MDARTHRVCCVNTLLCSKQLSMIQFWYRFKGKNTVITAMDTIVYTLLIYLTFNTLADRPLEQ